MTTARVANPNTSHAPRYDRSFIKKGRGVNLKLEELDYSDLDEYAIFVVVWQNTFMHLNQRETIIAAFCLLDRGWQPQQVADYLRVADRQVARWKQRRPIMADKGCHRLAVGSFRDRLQHQAWALGQAVDNEGLQPTGLRA